MKIKTKLTLGVGLLFLMILILSIISVKYVHELKADTENVLNENYKSLQYSKSMLLALDSLSGQSHSDFDNSLRLQEKNLTEIGEDEMTRSVRQNFEKIKRNKADSLSQWQIREDLFEIMEMNMQAIQRKSDLAQSTASKAVFWIAISGTLCFLIAFILLINLPANIANPIKELTESIRQIASENYSERVHFDDHNEFGDLAKSFNAMAQKLEEYNTSNLARLLEEKKRIETLIDQMHDPVIGLDENMRVIFANSEANKVLALEDSLLLGQQSKDIALRNDLMRELIKDLEESNEAGKIQKPIKIFAGGKQSYFEKDIQHITIVPTGESEPRLIGHVIRLHNVTEYKELDSAKTHFISNLSHEFKTPISSIKMGVQLLENEKMGILNSRQREVLNSITEDANRLLKSTFDLLNINQVESGNLKLVKVKVNIAEVLEKAVLANKSLADEKGIEIKITGEPYPEFLEIDVEKTIWVFSNLISNALRYSPDDSEINIDLTSSEDQLCIAFRDFGPGIPPEYQTRIFDRYFRVPNNTKEGTGLGLAISREFMEAQGGGISVKSQMGQGSTFFVTFPLDRN